MAHIIGNTCQPGFTRRHPWRWRTALAAFWLLLCLAAGAAPVDRSATDVDLVYRRQATGQEMPIPAGQDPGWPVTGPSGAAAPGAGSGLKGPDPFKLEFKYESRSTADSTRKDYYDLTYDPASFTPIITPKAYDKTFVSSENDLFLALKWTFDETQFFDIKETLHYQHYGTEDYDAYSLDSYKYKYLDHLLNLTYGVGFGETDTFQVDYFNNVYRIPIDHIWDYTSNQGKLRFNHQVNQYTGLGMEGSYEEREYPNDPTMDYKEGALTLDLSNFLPERIRYVPVSNAMRGDRETFERAPTGVAHRRAMDYYTTWTRKPGEDEPEAKYLSKVTRGDLYLFLQADIRSRDRSKIDNGYFQPLGTFKLVYDVLDNVKVTLDDTYYQRKHDKESDTYYLYDHDSNRASLMLTYQSDPRFSYYYTFSDEFFRHTKRKQYDYRIDTFLFETYYRSGRSTASLSLREALTRYGSPRQYYVDSNEFQAILGYDYPITRTFLLHLKDEWTDHDYQDFEDVIYSSYVRHTWRVALEKQLSPQQGLELGYQSKRETHTTQYSNDVIEKSLFFSWLSHF
ncbi:MAG: hypothetical protein GX442_05630 [Candidatus Riflebacteria bacterium]|nr:hypothetical protein [Candidatus Riflebacteria bacterium]